MAGLAKAELRYQGGPPFVVLFNPTSLKVTYANHVESGGAKGDQQVQYAGKRSAKFSVELTFDTTDVDTSTVALQHWGDAESRFWASQGQGRDVDVRHFTDRLAGMLALRPSKPAGAQDGAGSSGSPPPAAANDQGSTLPRVTFSWGSFVFSGVLNELGENLELFSPDGIPLRSIVTLTFSEGELLYPKSIKQVNEPPLAVAAAGATLAGVALSVGLDPLQGKLVAQINGLDDLRVAPTGAALALPSGGVSASASAGFSLSAGAGAGASAGLTAGVSASASASASFGVSASASASASVGASVSGGFGGGAGLGITVGGGGSFGLEVGAATSIAAGFGASASLSASLGLSAGLSAGVGVSAGLSAGIGMSAGMSAGVGASVAAGVAVSGGVAGVSSSRVAVPGAGSIGGPSAGGAPGAQSVMGPDGRIALAPAAPPAALPPAHATAAAGVSTARAVPVVRRPDQAQLSPAAALGTLAATPSTRVAGAVGLSNAPAVSLGLPLPPPPGAAVTAGGAFAGIRGVPLRQTRFGIAMPAVKALAYRRLPPETGCLEGPGICDAPAGATAATRKHKKGCTCAGCH